MNTKMATQATFNYSVSKKSIQNDKHITLEFHSLLLLFYMTILLHVEKLVSYS